MSKCYDTFAVIPRTSAKAALSESNIRFDARCFVRDLYININRI